jgi:hypothetical protein
MATDDGPRQSTPLRPEWLEEIKKATSPKRMVLATLFNSAL